MKFLLILFLCLSVQKTFAEDDPPEETTVTHTIDSITSTTMTPETTEAAATTTTDISQIAFDTPESVTNELNEAWSDLNRTVYNSIANFMKYSKDKLDNEVLRVFSDLEKVDSYDKFEKLCPPDQVTAYEEFQTSVDGLTSHWILIEHGKIDDTIEAIYKSSVTPLKKKISTDIEAPMTTKLRYPRGKRKEDIVACAKNFIPKTILFIESAFNQVIDCLVMNMNYKETVAYQESITKMYEDVAGVITTCNGVVSCLKKNCPKFHLLVVRTVDKAANAMTSIITNFRGEVNSITSCTKTRFSDKAFTATLTTLTADTKTCLG